MGQEDVAIAKNYMIIETQPLFWMTGKTKAAHTLGGALRMVAVHVLEVKQDDDGEDDDLMP